MTDKSDIETTEKVERTDVGYRVSIESTRGTGTRDQDKVKAEMRTEKEPSVDEIDDLEAVVSHTMEKRRNHEPDADTESEQ